MKKNTDQYTAVEQKLFKRLNTPAKIQDYINSIPANFEKSGQTCHSPREVIRHNTAHCMEGALLAAAVLEFYGEKPLVMDLRANRHDQDHVVAVFRRGGYFGAISKTNHAVLRYREPVYKTVRELVLSFFHEYFNDRGVKTLREYSNLVDLNRFNSLDWRTSTEDLFEIPAYLDDSKHVPILSKTQIKNLRKADKIEVEAGKITEWKKK